ncbi:MAG: hypothetical protein ABI539_13495 [Acidobacteriota bacterium]
MAAQERTAPQRAGCPSGFSTARLIGWNLDNKQPLGKAVFDETKNRLEVSVENVGLPDGHQLSVLIGDDRIGSIGALKEGSASGAVDRQLKSGARVRIFDDDRPIVSGNLVSDNTRSATTPPRVSPSATPGESPTVSPSLSPSASPAPTVSPSESPTASPELSPTASPAVR